MPAAYMPYGEPEDDEEVNHHEFYRMLSWANSYIQIVININKVI